MRFLFRTSWVLVVLMVCVLGLSGQAFAASQVDQVRGAKYGKFGGSFTLTDPHGKTVKDTDFLGQYMFVFFGYTSCPDVCPTTLQTVGDALDLMGEAGKVIQPIFITVDPKRDTQDILRDFSSHFSPRIISLTGDQKAIEAVTKNYGVRFEKVFDSSSLGDQDYSMNHSAGLYLMNRKGKFLVVFPYGVSVEDMARNLLGIIKKY